MCRAAPASPRLAGSPNSAAARAGALLDNSARLADALRNCPRRLPQTNAAMAPTIGSCVPHTPLLRARSYPGGPAAPHIANARLPFRFCGRGGTGRRATLRSLWAKARGSSSLLDRTRQSGKSSIWGFTQDFWTPQGLGFSVICCAGSVAVLPAAKVATLEMVTIGHSQSKRLPRALISLLFGRNQKFGHAPPQAKAG